MLTAFRYPDTALAIYRRACWAYVEHATYAHLAPSEHPLGAEAWAAAPDHPTHSEDPYQRTIEAMSQAQHRWVGPRGHIDAVLPWNPQFRGLHVVEPDAIPLTELAIALEVGLLALGFKLPRAPAHVVLIDAVLGHALRFHDIVDAPRFRGQVVDQPGPVLGHGPVHTPRGPAEVTRMWLIRAPVPGMPQGSRGSG